jgi:hypothetical protein
VFRLNVSGGLQKEMAGQESVVRCNQKKFSKKLNNSIEEINGYFDNEFLKNLRYLVSL